MPRTKGVPRERTIQGKKKLQSCARCKLSSLFFLVEFVVQLGCLLSNLFVYRKPRLKTLIEQLWDENLIVDVVREQDVDLERMPLGRLSKKTVDRGHTILEQVVASFTIKIVWCSLYQRGKNIL